MDSHTDRNDTLTERVELSPSARLATLSNLRGARVVQRAGVGTDPTSTRRTLGIAGRTHPAAVRPSKVREIAGLSWNERSEQWELRSTDSRSGAPRPIRCAPRRDAPRRLAHISAHEPGRDAVPNTKPGQRSGAFVVGLSNLLIRGFAGVLGRNPKECP